MSDCSAAMDGDEEAAAASAAAGLQQRLIDEEMARKKEEIRVLQRWLQRQSPLSRANL